MKSLYSTNNFDKPGFLPDIQGKYLYKFLSSCLNYFLIWKNSVHCIIKSVTLVKGSELYCNKFMDKIDIIIINNFNYF